MAGEPSDSDDFLDSLSQHLFRLQKTHVTKLFHRRADVVFSKRLFESTAGHADVPDNVCHVDWLVKAVMNEAQRRDHLRVFHRQAVGTATFNDLSRRNVDGAIWTGFAPHQAFK